MNIKMLLSYVGSHYFGWQKTGDGPSIEETLKQALEALFHKPISLQAASRTDKGVHAEGQVVNFTLTQSSLSLTSLPHRLNKMLPPDIRVLEVSCAEENFHPTLDCIGKEYHYFVDNAQVQSPFQRHFSWHIKMPLDIALMKQASTLLLGCHDFTPFSKATSLPENPLRHIYRFDIFKQDLIRFEIFGDAFLRNMVRILVGTLISIGLHKKSVDVILDAFSTKKRALLGMTAPPHGLFLKKVVYPAQLESGDLSRNFVDFFQFHRYPEKKDVHDSEK